MKKVISLLLATMSCLPATAVPSTYPNSGPIQCPMCTPQKMTPQEFLDSLFDHSPQAIALAQEYRDQLFENKAGKDILRRANQDSEHFVILIHATSSGIEKIGRDKAQIFHPASIQINSKKRFESDVESLINSRSSQLNTSGIPFKYFRTVEIEITPAGVANFKLRKLQLKMVVLKA